MKTPVLGLSPTFRNIPSVLKKFDHKWLDMQLCRDDEEYLDDPTARFKYLKLLLHDIKTKCDKKIFKRLKKASRAEFAKNCNTFCIIKKSNVLLVRIAFFFLVYFFYLFFSNFP